MTLEEFRATRQVSNYDEACEYTDIRPETTLKVFKYNVMLFIVLDNRGWAYDWGHPCNSYGTDLADAEEKLYEEYYLPR